jgi:hypothetical protein
VTALAASGRFQAVLDADVLYSGLLRDFLLRLSAAGLYRARWTERILDEVFRNVAANRPDLDPARLSRTRELMNAAVEDVLVRDYERLIGTVSLPDPDDRHVVAAALRCRAEVVVTRNLRHFPAAALEPLGIEPQHPDEFVLGLIDTAPGAVAAVVAAQVEALALPPMTVPELLDALERAGLAQTATELRRLI